MNMVDQEKLEKLVSGMGLVEELQLQWWLGSSMVEAFQTGKRFQHTEILVIQEAMNLTKGVWVASFM